MPPIPSPVAPPVPPGRNQPALDFLARRQSRPAKTLSSPGPDVADVTDLLTLAARTPDHGKLEPWRFVVLHPAALHRVAREIGARGPAHGIDPDKIAKSVGTYSNTPLAVVVVSSPKPSDKVPVIEQTLSAGAVCLALVNGCEAAGWGANWLSGWFTHDPAFREQVFGLADHETIAGIIHIGTPGALPPDRPRPDIAALTTWVTA